MSRTSDLTLSAFAPAVWGSTYIVTSQVLPVGHPLGIAMLRALPAGLVLLVIVRRLPPVALWGQLAVLGLLNFALFFAMLFAAAYRLPGGVAATLGAVQPIIVLILARLWLGSELRLAALGAAVGGLVGVALLVFEPTAALDPLGILAALAGACSMAVGVVLTRKWQPDVPPLTFTAWQLTAGGLLLVPLALAFEPSLPRPSLLNLAGYLWLGLPGGALAYLVWFRGIARLGPSGVAPLGFLSPLSAVVLGWAIVGEALTLQQITGAILVLLSVWASVTPKLPIGWRRARSA